MRYPIKLARESMLAMLIMLYTKTLFYTAKVPRATSYIIALKALTGSTKRCDWRAP